MLVNQVEPGLEGVRPRGGTSQGQDTFSQVTDRPLVKTLRLRDRMLVRDRTTRVALVRGIRHPLMLAKGLVVRQADRLGESAQGSIRAGLQGLRQREPGRRPTDATLTAVAMRYTGGAAYPAAPQ